MQAQDILQAEIQLAVSVEQPGPGRAGFGAWTARVRIDDALLPEEAFSESSVVGGSQIRAGSDLATLYGLCDGLHELRDAAAPEGRPARLTIVAPASATTRRLAFFLGSPAPVPDAPADASATERAMIEVKQALLGLVGRGIGITLRDA